MAENKRVIVPGRASVILAPGVENLLGDALRVIELEITRFHHRLQRGQSLTGEDARILQGYIRSLVELSKEKREREKDEAEDLANMSNEDLVALCQKLIAAKEQPNEPKQTT
jgi:hypothetical protein